MANRLRSANAGQHLLIEDLIDQSKPGVSHEPFAGGGHNSGGFLATVLQRVQAQVCEGYGVFMTPNAKETTMMSNRGFLHAWRRVPASSGSAVAIEARDEIFEANKLTAIKAGS